jgi:hypothetical protein
VPPFCLNLKFNSKNEELWSLLDALIGIYASKYYLLPSHLVTSTLQMFTLFSYESFSLGEFVRVEELICKIFNIILTKYSKKFSKLSAIVCNLLVKLIGAATLMSNQNTLPHENIHLAIKAAQDLER